MSRGTRWIGAILLGVLLAGDALAQSSAPPSSALSPPPTLTAANLESLSKILRSMVLQNLPESPTFTQNHEWGHQARVPTLQGVKIVHVLRNHGNWWKVQATCYHLPQTLVLKLSDMKIADPEHITFKTYLALPTTIEFRQQIWQNGVRVLVTKARARMRIKAHLNIETSLKLDAKGALLPDLVLGLRIADAQVSYDRLVLENIDGIGGDAARVTGDAVRAALKQWKPSLERDLLAKARTAILRAGETREVRVSLTRLISGEPR